jgi:apolipoprotein N-acyltransferase
MRAKRWAWTMMASLGGLCVAAAAPPTRLWPFPVLGVALWGLSLSAAPSVNRLRAFALGTVFGITANLLALRFVPATVQRFTELPAPVAWLCLLLLAAAQGLTFGLGGWVYADLRRRGVSHPLSLGAGLYAVTFVPCIFPWTPAAPLSAWPVLVQSAEVIGERGICLLLGVFAGLLGQAVQALRGRQHASARAALAMAASLALTLVAYGMLRVRQVTQERARAPQVTIAVLQPGFAAEERWNEARARALLEHLGRLTKQAEERGAQLVVWPESAYPYHLGRSTKRSPIGERAVFQAGAHGPVITGMYLLGGHGVAFNAAVLVQPDGTFAGVYDKRHLLWFGETIPLSDVFPILTKWFSRGTGIRPGQNQVVLHTGDIRAGVLNCYEDTLPQAGRDSVQGANLLVNVTNDAWFEGTIEGDLHLMLATMRSVETRRDMARAVNLGPTSIVDATGTVRARYADAMPSPLLGQVALLDGTTLYAKWGDAGALLLLAAVLGAELLRQRNTKQQRRDP